MTESPRRRPQRGSAERGCSKGEERPSETRPGRAVSFDAAVVAHNNPDVATTAPRPTALAVTSNSIALTATRGMRTTVTHSGVPRANAQHHRCATPQRENPRPLA